MLVLSGAARQAYHGVPVVLSKPDIVNDNSAFETAYKNVCAHINSPHSTLPEPCDYNHSSFESNTNLENEEEKMLRGFLKRTRINLSMRRV